MFLKFYNFRLLSPGILFSLVWIFALITAWVFPFDSRDLNLTTYVIILGFCLLFLAFDFFLSPSSRNIVFPVIAFDSLRVFRYYARLFFFLWLFIFLLTIAYTGDLPLLSLITGSGFTYTSFAIPTLGGLGNLSRIISLQLILIYLLYSLYSRAKFQLTDISGFFLLLFSPIVFTLSRGDQVLCLLTVAFTGALFFPRTFMQFKFRSDNYFLYTILLLPTALLLFGFFQYARHGNLGVLSADQPEAISYFLAQSRFELLNEFFGFHPGLHLVFSALIVYISAPIYNLSLQLDTFHWFAFSDSIFSSIFPTVIRDFFFPSSADRYGELVIEAFNTSTFMPSFFNSFGIIGGSVLIAFIFFVASICYSRSLSSLSLYYRFLYPFLASSIALSFFSNFFLILTVLMSPIILSPLCTRLKHCYTFLPVRSL